MRPMRCHVCLWCRLPVTLEVSLLPSLQDALESSPLHGAQRRKDELRTRKRTAKFDTTCAACDGDGRGDGGPLLQCKTEGCFRAYHAGCLKDPSATTETACLVCHCTDHDAQGEGAMLLCDRPECGNGCHLRCHRPQLRAVPSGPWFCSGCDGVDATSISSCPDCCPDEWPGIHIPRATEPMEVIKFHMLVHFGAFIVLFGALRNTRLDHLEAFHKWFKLAYRTSNKVCEMFGDHLKTFFLQRNAFRVLTGYQKWLKDHERVVAVTPAQKRRKTVAPLPACGQSVAVTHAVGKFYTGKGATLDHLRVAVQPLEVTPFVRTFGSLEINHPQPGMSRLPCVPLSILGVDVVKVPGAQKLRHRCALPACTRYDS